MGKKVSTKGKAESKAKPKTAAKKTTKKTVKAKPTQEQIKAKAYEIYVESGFQGTELENWLKAEKELKKS